MSHLQAILEASLYLSAIATLIVGLVIAVLGAVIMLGHEVGRRVK